MTSIDIIKPHAVYEAIAQITGELAKVGIAKIRKNQQQGYSFRGIDDIYSALARLLAQHQLCIIPRVLTRTVSEHPTKGGGTLFYSLVDVEFDLVSAKDGSMHTARTTGEAMDSGDKSTNKAMSAAYKYFALQTFCIPTEGDNDADASTHEPATPVLITPSQIADLDALITEVGANKTKLLAYLKIADLADIHVDHYSVVVRTVEAKRGQAREPARQS